MNLGVVTAWPPQLSGLSEYSRYLYETMSKLSSKLNIIIYAPKPETTTPHNIKGYGGIKVKYVWERNSLIYPLKLAKAACLDGVRVIHVQHEYWLYGRGLKSLSLLLLLIILRVMLRKVVLTIHGLMPIPPDRHYLLKYHKLSMPYSLLKLSILLYIRLLSLLANTVIVHLNIMKKVLVEQYGIKHERIHVITHGIPNPENDGSAHRNHMFLVFGSIRPDKGLEQVIKAFADLNKRYKDVELVIAGSYNPKTSPESAGYLSRVIEILNELKVSNVRFRFNIPSEELVELFKEAYAVVLNYLDTNVIAASGPLALAVAYGKPVIVTNIPRFIEYRDIVIAVEPESLGGIKKAMETLMEDRELYESLRNRLHALRMRDSWFNVAKNHLKIYAGC